MPCVLKGDAVVIISTLGFNVRTGGVQEFVHDRRYERHLCECCSSASPAQFLHRTSKHVATWTTFGTEILRKSQHLQHCRSISVQRVEDPCLRLWHWRSQTIDRSGRTDADKATADGFDANGLTKEKVRGYVEHSKGLSRA